jgi:hypothetical protein
MRGSKILERHPVGWIRSRSGNTDNPAGGALFGRLRILNAQPARRLRAFTNRRRQRAFRSRFGADRRSPYFR